MYSGTGSVSLWDARKLERPNHALFDGFGTEPPQLLAVPPPLVGGGVVGSFVGYCDQWDVDASHQAMRLQGDWFREPDTTRGCALANPGVVAGLSLGSEASAFDGYSGAWGMDESHQDVRLPGDWFCEPDDTKRGLTLENPGLLGDLSLMGGGKAHQLDDFSGDTWWKSNDDWPATGDIVKDPAEAPMETPNFADDVQPAEVPCCGANSSSFTLKTDSAAQVANVMYSFLTQEVKSSMEKVRTQKFWIKAHVFVEVGGCRCSCTLKARVFRAADDPLEGARQLVVEFSRRSGDAVGFRHVFEQASKFIQQRCNLLGSHVGTAQVLTDAAVESPAPPPVLTGTTRNVEPSDLEPLLDMVSEAFVPAAQAEALESLIALAGASAAGAAVVLAIWERLQEVLVCLMSSTEVSVAYPAACLAYELARHGGGETAKRLVLAALQGAQAGGTNPLVRFQLAEVVRVGAPHFAEATPNTCRADVRGALEQALSSAPSNHVVVVGRRQEAHFETAPVA